MASRALDPRRDCQTTGGRRDSRYILLAAHIAHQPSLVRDLTDACPVDRVLLVREAEHRRKRDDAPYLRLVLADRSGSVPAVLWDADQAPTLEPGDAVHVTG